MASPAQEFWSIVVDVTQAIAGIVGISVAINASFLIIYGIFRHRSEREFFATVKRLDRNEEYIKTAITNLGQQLHRVHIRMELLENNIIRTLRACGIQASSMQKIIDALEVEKTDLVKSQEELTLFSNEVTDRVAAFRHLAQGFGDVETLSIMELVLQDESDPQIKKEMKHYMKLLKTRFRLR